MLPNTGEKVLNALPYVGIVIVVVIIGLFIYKKNKNK